MLTLFQSFWSPMARFDSRTPLYINCTNREWSQRPSTNSAKLSGPFVCSVQSMYGRVRDFSWRPYYRDFHATWLYVLKEVQLTWMLLHTPFQTFQCRMELFDNRTPLYINCTNLESSQRCSTNFGKLSGPFVCSVQSMYGLVRDFSWMLY